ncbi:hypothetical protein CMQ_4251 [Grosmannia clavigera kw1407]|uniref:Acyltransferase 3 domain-containing protein n=1 Tax=Grosmannia clavigera (strain kw1407 / UAMH 11150) TaxID=655863 RepID=F0XIC1_GROCL|nr:uncharacterized protein CMQ_4251 [Grosmannia clavigera kw1407]EFX02571.1 hypothetical protein CMQ_4251 [Grosmannia clavigera kw1407]
MPSNLEDGLLDRDGMASQTRELMPWQSATWETSGAIITPAKRKLRWLRTLLWPAANADSGGIRASGSGTASGSGPRSLRPTAYLDGLRGFAAFLVYIHHHQLWAHAASLLGDDQIFENAYGYNGQYRFATLPGVRNFFTGGHMAVATFYVISGYVLAAKPLSLIHAGEHVRLLDNLASSMFRRWIRLYFPIIVTTFVYVTSWHVFGIWTSCCVQQGSIFDEWWNWYVEFKNFSFVFKEGFIWVTYNNHLWSIPLEMRGSIVVFSALLSFARITTRARHCCMLGLTFYFLYVADGYYCALFVMGMLQCDLDMMAQRSDPEFPTILRRLEPYKKAIYYTLFIISMYLAGVPSETNSIEKLRNNPGWYWLSFLKPQAVFDPKWIGPMGLEISFLLPHIILLPVTLWVADIVTRTVDEPTVRIANWFYKSLLSGNTASQPRPEGSMRLA